MPSPRLNQPYSVVTIACGHCKQKQLVHILARTGFWLGGRQAVKCLRCGQEFDVMLPDSIIGGPFLPEQLT
jgi:DNA-directed RNA polymerase subunit RPC12/RpoP